MASDSNGYGALSSINWNTYVWPPPAPAKLTEHIETTRSFPPLVQVMPGPSDEGKRMPSAGTRFKDPNPQGSMR